MVLETLLYILQALRKCSFADIWFHDFKRRRYLKLCFPSTIWNAKYSSPPEEHLTYIIYRDSMAPSTTTSMCWSKGDKTDKVGFTTEGKQSSKKEYQVMEKVMETFSVGLFHVVPLAGKCWVTNRRG